MFECTELVLNGPGFIMIRCLFRFTGAVLFFVFGCECIEGHFQRNAMQVIQPGEFDLDSSSEKRSLGGRWEFCLDAEQGGRQVEYADMPGAGKAWAAVSVPGVFETGRNPKGIGWYRRTFEAYGNDLAGGEGAVLRFLGVNLRCRVFINGQMAGENRYAYVPFEVPAGKFLREGENEIVVAADHTILERGIPDSRWNGWWCYGGIFRDVYLDYRPGVSVHKCRLEAEMFGDKWKGRMVVTVHNQGQFEAVRTVRFRVLDKGREIFSFSNPQRLRPGENEVAAVHVFEDVEVWEVGKGRVYDIICEVEGSGGRLGHRLKTTGGFREIRTHKGRILVNGKPLQVRGICVHEEDGERGCAVSREWIERTVDRCVELGCNFVRTGHYTFDPYFYKLCDRAGLLVWSEIPAWKTDVNVLADPLIFESLTKGYLQAMVREYQAHPCVAIWSVGNEFASDKAQARWYVRAAREAILEADQTRPVTFASDRHRKDKMDVCFDLVDLIAVNEYYGWYYGEPQDIGVCLDRLGRLYPDKPVVVSEFGCGAAPDGRTQGRKTDPRKPYTSVNQAEYLKLHMNEIFAQKRQDFVPGGFLWLLRDFRDPHRTGGGHPIVWDYVNLKGILDMQDEEKESYEVVREFYRELQK